MGTKYGGLIALLYASLFLPSSLPSSPSFLFLLSSFPLNKNLSLQPEEKKKKFERKKPPKKRRGPKRD
jgi:hypothetical protein